MPDRPPDPRSSTEFLNKTLERLRAVERQVTRLPDGAEPLQTFESGQPLGDTRFLDFGPGIQSTLIGDDYVRISADAGEMVFDALVDGALVASEPTQRKFKGIGEALTYLSTTVGLVSCAVFVRAVNDDYSETANFASPAKVFLFSGRGDQAQTDATSNADPNVNWDWNQFRPSSQIMLHIENFHLFEPRAGTSGGAFTSVPLSYLYAKNSAINPTHSGTTAYLCQNGTFETCTFRFLPGTGTTTQRICQFKGTFIQCDGEQAPSSSGTLTLIPATDELLMVGCRWDAATSGTHFLTLATASNVELTYVKNRQATSTPTGFITINVAGGSRNRLVLVNETNGANDMQWLVVAASAFESLDFFGQARVTVTGAHDWCSVTGSIQDFWDITGPAVVNGSTANSGRLILRGQGIAGSVSGDGLTATATRVQFIAASFCAIQAAFDATGAAVGNSPYSFNASSNLNTLIYSGQSTFGTAGTDAGTGNRVLPESVLLAGHIIEDEGVGLTQQPNLNFVGAGVTVTDSAPDTIVTIPGGAGHVIQDEGVSLAARTNLNFVGAGVTVTDDAGNDQTDVTISGGGGGGGDTLVAWVAL